MKQTHCHRAFIALLTITISLFTGCSQVNHYVVAQSSTVLGVEIAQNPQTQAPTGKVGYVRSETALVPTNRFAPPPPGDGTPSTIKYEYEGTPAVNVTTPNYMEMTVSHDASGKPIFQTKPVRVEGADEATDVLMELKATDVLSFDMGIYQRLAVGKTAVSQPGAAFMMAKDENGNISPETAEAISASLGKGVPNESAARTIAFFAISEMLEEFGSSDDNAKKLHESLMSLDVGFDRDITTYTVEPNGAHVYYVKVGEYKIPAAAKGFYKTQNAYNKIRENVVQLKEAVKLSEDKSMTYTIAAGDIGVAESELKQTLKNQEAILELLSKSISESPEFTEAYAYIKEHI